MLSFKILLCPLCYRTTHFICLMGCISQRRATSLLLSTCGTCWREKCPSCLSSCPTGETWTVKAQRTACSVTSELEDTVFIWKIFSFRIQQSLTLSREENTDQHPCGAWYSESMTLYCTILRRVKQLLFLFDNNVRQCVKV